MAHVLINLASFFGGNYQIFDFPILMIPILKDIFQGKTQIPIPLETQIDIQTTNKNSNNEIQMILMMLKDLLTLESSKWENQLFDHCHEKKKLNLSNHEA
jgi:hypothetical protein